MIYLAKPNASGPFDLWSKCRDCSKSKIDNRLILYRAVDFLYAPNQAQASVPTKLKIPRYFVWDVFRDCPETPHKPTKDERDRTRWTRPMKRISRTNG